MSSENLVPGDIIALDDINLDIPCDCILLSGEAIVDESMLTGTVRLIQHLLFIYLGETLPVCKKNANHPRNTAQQINSRDSSSWLFGGTKLLKASSSACSRPTALICRSGMPISRLFR